MASPDVWSDYGKAFLDVLLSEQKPEGGFRCPTDYDLKQLVGVDVDRMVGAAYPTAVFAIVFALPIERSNLRRVHPQTRTSGRRSAERGGRIGPINGLGQAVCWVHADALTPPG